MNRLTEALERAALKITNSVGTMYCAIGFGCLTLISLPAAIATHDPVIIVQWCAATFLQLVLLPIIMVGQRLASTRTEGLIQETHDIVVQELSEVKDTHGLVVQELAAIKALLPSIPSETP